MKLGSTGGKPYEKGFLKSLQCIFSSLFLGFLIQSMHKLLECSPGSSQATCCRPLTNAHLIVYHKSHGAGRSGTLLSFYMGITSVHENTHSSVKQLCQLFLCPASINQAGSQNICKQWYCIFSMEKKILSNTKLSLYVNTAMYKQHSTLSIHERQRRQERGKHQWIRNFIWTSFSCLTALVNIFVLIVCSQKVPFYSPKYQDCIYMVTFHCSFFLL